MTHTDDTVLPHLFSSNIAPSTSEALFAQKQVQAIASEANSIDKEMLALALRLTGLRAQKAKLDRQLEQYRWRTSTEYAKPGGMQPSSFPTYGVRSWLKYLHQTPCAKVSPGGSGAQGIFLERYISKSHRKRSGSTWIVSPAIGFSGSPTATAKHAHSKIPPFGKLLQNVPPLDALSLCNTRTPLCFERLAASIGAASIGAAQGKDGHGVKSLRSLSIFAQHWGDYWTNIPSSSFSFIPECLETLDLHLPRFSSLYSTRESLDVNIPEDVLERLTTLRLTCNWTVDFVLKILRYCTAAKSIEIDSGPADGAEGDWRDIAFMAQIRAEGICLPRLEALTLSGLYLNVLGDLKHLRLPSLAKLSIYFGIQEDSDGLAVPVAEDRHSRDLATFLLGGDPPGQPTLLSLELANVDFEWHNTLFNAIHAASSLRELTLNWVTFEENLFQRWRSGSYLPNLKVLKL
ncbi:hypothetical protein NMY22_g1434 [Coprinellus aureogranulatus]|nr:hypothetical protein NMY22_g1434 [Coprinellus aureogranulatus]